jgi:carbamoyltransferase
VLLDDGRTAFAASEERFDRVRHSAAFPAGAIATALASVGARREDVDVVAFPWERGMAKFRKAWHVLKGLPRSLEYLRKPPDGVVPTRQGYLAAMAGFEEAVLAAGIRAPLVHVPHHLAHAASSALAIPEGDGAILTADGMGEWTTAAAWRLAAGRLSCVRRAVYPDSPGKAYSAVTAWLGFRPDSDEGKTMGLAAYGDPDAPGARFARSLLAPDADRLLRIRREAFGFPWGEARIYGDAFLRELGPPRPPDAPLRSGDADVARGIQDAVEAFALDAARRLLAETGARVLGLAGGLFLNCALNGRLAAALDAEVRPFPVAGDAGAAWGAAAHVHRQRARRDATPLRSLRLGRDLTDREAEAAAPDARRPEDLAGAVADAIVAGRVVAVARGRAEFGPRALGGRSVLASPRTEAMRDEVNRRKGREAWRPLGPVVREGAGAWFRGLGRSPHMILTVEATAAARAEVPAAVHRDGTARVQTVGPGDDPFLLALLDALERRGHPPAVLNTSLNRRGEPIVDTAAQAVASARAMGLDAVVLADRFLDLTPRP